MSGLTIQPCTIAARNYIAHARVLATSFRRFYPGGRLAVLLIDGERTDSADGIEFLSLSDIGLSVEEQHRMATMYDVTELSTAVKPWLLRTLVKRGDLPVAYFDPDIEIFTPLDDIAELARKHSIILTPHVTAPMPRDGRRLSEDDLLATGIYNLGFIAVSSESVSFLEWWAERLRRDCIIDPTRMRFTDQRWVDFVPALYQHHILRDVGCNVAYWNLHNRHLQIKDGGYVVNGGPLRFFHFSGYDPDQPHLLSKYQGAEPRVLLSERPAVATICGEYSRKLLDAGFSKAKSVSYGFAALHNGVKLDSYIRREYRRELMDYDAEAAPEPPNPWDGSDEAEFTAWIRAAMRDEPAVTRYMLAVHAALPVLQQKYPDPTGADAQPFHDWFVSRAEIDAGAQAVLMPASVSRVAPVAELASRNGDEDLLSRRFASRISEIEPMRDFSEALAVAGAPVNFVSDRDAASGDLAKLRPNHVTVCWTTSAADLPRRIGNAATKLREGVIVGLWLDDIEDLQQDLASAFHLLDEIWVPTRFVRDALRRIAPKPVATIRLPIVTGDPNRADMRSPASTDRRFTFVVTSHDRNTERTNAVAAIAAFSTAFREEEGPQLRVEVDRSVVGDLALEKLQHARRNRTDIALVSCAENKSSDSLLAACDCYVSLSRWESRPSRIGRALAAGVPVIATAHQANLELMNERNSYPCACQRSYRVRSSFGDLQFRACDPNVALAARLMRRVYDDQAAARAKGRRAAEEMRRLYSVESAAIEVRKRLLNLQPAA